MRFGLVVERLTILSPLVSPIPIPPTNTLAYDLEFDPKEEVNLLATKVYDKNRMKEYSIEEVYYYPRWDEAKVMYSLLKKEKEKIWRDGNFFERGLTHMANFYRNSKSRFSKKRTIVSSGKKYSLLNWKVKGRWNSKIR